MMAFCAIAALAIPAPLFDSGSKEKASEIYVNCSVYTVDKAFSKAEAIAVQGDKIVFVGTRAQAEKSWKNAKTEVIDLGGKTVIPGLIDSHLHYQMIGMFLERIDIFQKPKQEILDLVKAEAARLGPGKWIISMGWNNVLWNEDYPSKEDLDAVAPDNPVALSRVDGYSGWYNSLALQLAGVDQNTPNPQGGEILKKPNGDVWGILIDTAMEPVSAVIEATVSEEQILNRFRLANNDFVSQGLTTVVDAGESWNSIKVLISGYQSGVLKVRAYEMLDDGEDIAFINEGKRPTTDYLGNGRVGVNAVKVYSDGSLGSRSAWMLADYADREHHTGNGRWSDAEMTAIVRRVSGAGFQIGTHAIGDAAVRQVLNVYEQVLGATELKKRRFRIEHYQIAAPEDILRTIRLGVIPSMQTVHATSDMNMAEDRVGPERIKSSYAWRTVIKEGGYIANGTDAPVEAVSPWQNLYAAISRQDLNGQPPGGWYIDLAMTREEALRSYTIWGAQAMFAEGNRGSLEKGKYADFIILDRDYMTCPVREIADIQVLRTVIGGETIYPAK